MKKVMPPAEIDPFVIKIKVQYNANKEDFGDIQQGYLHRRIP
jgi:hypothetical protein